MQPSRWRRRQVTTGRPKELDQYRFPTYIASSPTLAGHLFHYLVSQIVHISTGGVLFIKPDIDTRFGRMCDMCQQLVPFRRRLPWHSSSTKCRSVRISIQFGAARPHGMHDLRCRDENLAADTNPTPSGQQPKSPLERDCGNDLTLNEPAGEVRCMFWALRI